MIAETTLISVRVLADGFKYEDEHFKSLSAVTRAVTGKHWNGSTSSAS